MIYRCTKRYLYMGLLDKNFKSDISSNDEMIKEEYGKYFSNKGEHDLKVKNDSLIFTTKDPGRTLRTNLSFLMDMQNESPFLSKFQTNSNLHIISISKYADKQFNTPFSICSTKQIFTTCDISANDNPDLSNTIIKCDKLTIFAIHSSVKNITLRTRMIHVFLESNLNPIHQIKGDIKTNSLAISFSGANALYNLRGVEKPLKKMFINWRSGEIYFKPEEYASIKRINPIKSLRLEHYNAMNYHFIGNDHILTFTKDSSIKNGIKMADGWFVVLDDPMFVRSLND